MTGDAFHAVFGHVYTLRSMLGTRRICQRTRTIFGHPVSLSVHLGCASIEIGKICIRECLLSIGTGAVCLLHPHIMVGHPLMRL